MATHLILLFILLKINSCLGYNDTNCTYLQTVLTTNKGQYFVAYIPYVCMSFGKGSSGMFSCQSNGQLRYQEYDDADCLNVVSTETNLDTGDTVSVDSDTSTIRDYDCRSTLTNDTCEFLDIRVYSSCDSFDSQFYDEVYIIDKCLPRGDTGTYQIISCTWFNATTTIYNDADCTQESSTTAPHIYDDSVQECTSSCRDLSNCRRNFTLCSTHPWSELENRCDWTSDVAKELFCDSQGDILYISLALLLWIALNVLYIT